jgi:hypothetical protein
MAVTVSPIAALLKGLASGTQGYFQGKQFAQNEDEAKQNAFQKRLSNLSTGVQDFDENGNPVFAPGVQKPGETAQQTIQRQNWENETIPVSVAMPGLAKDSQIAKILGEGARVPRQSYSEFIRAALQPQPNPVLSKIVDEAYGPGASSGIPANQLATLASTVQGRAAENQRQQQSFQHQETMQGKQQDFSKQQNLTQAQRAQIAAAQNAFQNEVKGIDVTQRALDNMRSLVKNNPPGADKLIAQELAAAVGAKPGPREAQMLQGLGGPVQNIKQKFYGGLNAGKLHPDVQAQLSQLLDVTSSNIGKHLAEARNTAKGRLGAANEAMKLGLTPDQLEQAIPSQNVFAAPRPQITPEEAAAELQRRRGGK